MLGAPRRAAVQAAQAVGRKAPEAAGKAVDKAGEAASKAVDKAGEFVMHHPEEVFRCAKIAKDAVLGINRGGPLAAVAVPRWAPSAPAGAAEGRGMLQWALIGVGLAAAVTAGVVAYRRWKKGL